MTKTKMSKGRRQHNSPSNGMRGGEDIGRGDKRRENGERLLKMIVRKREERRYQ